MKKLFAFCAAGLFAGASAAAGAAAGVPNFDAAYANLSAQAKAGGNRQALMAAKLHQRLLSGNRVKLGGYPSSFDSKLGAATFLWAPPSMLKSKASALPLSPAKPALRAETAARNYLSQEASYLRIDRQSVADARLFELHDLGHGPLIARFRQYKDGLEVFGRELNVMMDRSLKPVATSGYFAPAAKAATAASLRATATPQFAIGGADAIADAFADLGGKRSAAVLSAGRSAGGYTLYAAGRTGADYHLAGTQRARQVYYYLNGAYLPAWLVIVHATTVDHANHDDYGYVVSAVDGKVLFRKNLTDSDFSYRVFAGTSTPFQPSDEPINDNTLDPFTGGINDDQGRTQGSYSLVTLNNSGLIGQTAGTAAAANDPWLDAGATTTVGNNVVDFANLVGGDGYDTGDLYGAISAAATFDYPYAIDTDPTTADQRQAAIVNQFFVDNWLHDFWYDHGFDEASGNAQQSNYGRGGIEGDPIIAQAQDDSGRNNANMSTPPDGGSPTQRMYLWDGPLTGSSSVTTSATTGSLDFNTASFGARNFDVTGSVVVAQDSGGVTDGCNAPANAGALAGNIALVDRGTCSFTVKAANVQAAGAIAVIIADNRVESAPGMGGTDDTVTIGAVSITQADGATIKAALAGGTVTAHLVVQFGADRDGTMDIQIVAHEFFHYVSNRLVGDALGLGSQQGGGMGEGWSDFDAMLLTVRPEDALVTGNDQYQGAYPLSEYVSFSQYYGIRRYPYSTDMTVNPLTFKDISDGVALPTAPPPAFGQDGSSNSEVHNTGEVWCNTLWEIYAALLNDPRYTFAQARSRMQDYIIEGLKMTPVNPTILEARDALLAAAKATDTTDYQEMAAAFAKRGMGVDAVGPDRYDTTNSGVQESYVANAAGVAVSDVTLDFSGLPDSTHKGDKDKDGVLDVGETARLTFTFVNQGTADMSSSLTGQMDAVDGLTFSDGGAVVVPALAVGDSAQVSVLVTVDKASIAEQVALTLAFPDANNPQTGSFPTDGSGIAAIGAEYDTYINYNLKKSSTIDDVSDVTANYGDWTRTEDDVNGSGPGWDIVDTTGLFVDQQTSGNAWYGPDNDHPSDIALESPSIDVGTGDFSIAFDHFYDLEFAGYDGSGNAYGYDGGVIEVSTDGGSTWTDAFDNSIGAQVTTGAGYNGYILSLDPDGTFDPLDGGAHPGFIAANEDPSNPILEHVVVDFGTALAGQTIKFRFREVSDEGTGVLGWVVDNIAVTGSTNKPFSKTVANNSGGGGGGGAVAPGLLIPGLAAALLRRRRRRR